MSRSGERGPEAAGRNRASTALLHNRAFFELSRVMASGDAALLSSALPVLVRGAGIASAAVFSVGEDALSLAAAEGVPMPLRAHLEEQASARAPEFLVQRAAVLRRTLVDAGILGAVPARASAVALEEAGWQVGIAVPILAGGSAAAVMLAGVPASGAAPETVAFLEAAANLLGAALPRPPGRAGSSSPPRSPGASPRPRSSGPGPVRRSTPPELREVSEDLAEAPAAVACAGCVTALSESLGALGREIGAQHALLRDMGSRPGAAFEVDVLLGQARSLDRAFRKLAELSLHLPGPVCTHGKRPVSMATVVDVAVQAARPALAAARAEVEVVCGPACELVGDPELLAVAVRHLVVNAAEAFHGVPASAIAPSLRRCVRICVRAEGPSAAVHVEDSGPGVPHDVRARAFEPTVTTKGPGRGLGLAVARQVVESHGGWMELGASEMGGTRVSVFVPSRSRALDELRRAQTLPQVTIPTRRPPRPSD